MRECQPGIRLPELLAPAGNYECFLAAIHAGADAVYLAGKRFGARALADNFDESELVSAIRYAHLFGRNVYMTVNTLLKDNELDGLASYLAPYVEAGLDAVIVQDFGVLAVVRREFPKLAVHCSTQMTITDEWGVRMAGELGASRVVPARELTLSEIRTLKQAHPDMELECFIHGAMCYCYSGQCLMSSLIGGRSGNRGACAQPCRLPYKVELPVHHHKETCCPLSLKDLCAVRLLPELIEAGVDSFKIEGRMKRPEYCAGVTAVYRAVIDRYFSDKEAAQGVTEEEMQLLNGLYVRSEIGEGYYRTQTGRQMLTKEKPGYRGCREDVLAALRERYLTQRLFISVSMELTLKSGEAARLTVRNDRAQVTCTGAVVQTADNRPLTVQELEKRLSKTGGTPFTVERIEILMTEPVFLPVGQLNELRREAFTRMEEALSARREKEHAKEKEKAALCMVRTDSAETTPSRAGEAFCTSDKTVPGRAEHTFCAAEVLETGKGNARGFLAVVETAEQFAACCAHPLIRGICAAAEVYEACLRMPKKSAADCRTKNCYLSLPRILRGKDTERLRKKIAALIGSGVPIEGIYVHTAGEYRYAVSLAETWNKRPREWIFGSPFFYCMNVESARFWKEKMHTLSLPYELCGREIRSFLKRADQAGISGFEMPVYGYIPMMVTANCIVRSFDKAECPNSDAPVRLTDRMGKTMEVRRDCVYCLNTIYNSVPLSMHKHMHDLQKLYEDGMIGAFTMNFTTESAERTKEVLDRYHSKNTEAWEPGSYTNGHFQRGVT